MRKWVRVAAVVPLLLLQAAAPSVFSSYWGTVNILDYGAKGDGSTDDTAAIQSAIDAAYSAKKQGVYLPATGHCYKTTAALFLDPPGNLRSNFANPTNFAFSLAMFGDQGLGNNNAAGTQLCPTFQNDCAIYVGPGQGMVVRNLSINGLAGTYRKLQSSVGCGVGLTGGSGGSSRTTLENVGVTNFYYCFRTAANGNGVLGDSNTGIKLWSDNCAYGFYIGGSQNFINSCYDCNFNNSNVAFSSVFGTGATLTGGNYSAVGGVSNAFPISGTSSVTAATSGNAFDYSFTTTLSSDDVYMQGCASAASCSYNACSVATTSFGVVPLTVTAYNTGTKVASLKALTSWSIYYFPGSNAVTSSDLQTEIQAATKLYCAEQSTVIEGSGIRATGIHVENPNGPTSLIHSREGIGQGRLNHLEEFFFNYDPALSNWAPSTSPTDANLAKYYAAVSFPLIWVENAGLQISNSTLGAISDPVMIDLSPSGADAQNFVLDSNARLVANIRVATSSGGFGNAGTITLNNPNFGAGKLDQSYTFPVGVQGGNSQGFGWILQNGAGVSPMWGYRPAAWSRPALTPSMVTTLSGALPSITHSGSGASIAYALGYPPIWGGQNYQLADWYVGTQASGYNIVSNHHFYSLGQNLTTSNVPNLSVSYKGQSFVVSANIELLRMLWPGLGIQLNNGGGNVLYIITGVYPGLGYFTVAGAQSATDTSRLSGTKTTTYGPITTVGQESFSLTRY